MNDRCEKWKTIREKKGEITGKNDIIGRCGECFPPPQWEHFKHFEITSDLMDFLQVLCVFPKQPLDGRGDFSSLPWVHLAGLLGVRAGGWINIPTGSGVWIDSVIFPYCPPCGGNCVLMIPSRWCHWRGLLEVQVPFLSLGHGLEVLSAVLLPQVFLLFAPGARDVHFSMAIWVKPHHFPGILDDVFLILADSRWKYSCDNVWRSLLQKLKWGN